MIKCALQSFGIAAGCRTAAVITAFLLWALMVAAQASGAYSVHDTVAANASYAIPLDVPQGHVVLAEFKGKNSVLELQDKHGGHLRRLSIWPTFLWLTSDNQQLVVRNPSSAPDEFEFKVLKVLTPGKGDAADHAKPLISPRLRKLQATLAQGGGTEDFWTDIRRNGSPLVEPHSDGQSLVTFLWRGPVKSVRMFGGPSGDHDPLQHLEGSDVWWETFLMPNTARFSYRLAPDVPQVEGSAREQRMAILATAQRDPYNPHVFPGAVEDLADIYQGESVLALPDAPVQPWVERRAGVAEGVLSREVFDSALLGNQRDIWVYRPAGAAPEALLVIFDASAYLEQVSVPRIIDNLLADELIPSTAVVLIDNACPTSRGEELPPNPLFARFLDEELMVWIEKQGLGQPPSRTVIAGSSYGGLAAAYAALRNPHRFGNVLSMSGSYWWAPKGERPGWMMRAYASAPLEDVRFYLDAGRYESTHHGVIGILETNRHLGDVLRAKGYAVTQFEHDTGHDYLHWQGSLGCGLVALLNPGRLEEGLRGCAANQP